MKYCVAYVNAYVNGYTYIGAVLTNVYQVETVGMIFTEVI